MNTITKEMDVIFNKLPKSLIKKVNKLSVASYDSSNPLSLKRIPRSQRVKWDFSSFYSFLEKNKITNITELETIFNCGLVILLINNDYFTIKNSNNPIHKELINRIGSNNNISVVLFITRNYNGTWINNFENLLNLFNIEKEVMNWKPLKKIKKCNFGNSYWTGHYCIDTTGAIQNGKKEGNIQLANDISEYSSIKNSESIKYKMIMLLLHSRNINNFLEQTDIERYFELYNIYSNNAKLNYIINNKLLCCISLEEISIEDFLEENKIQLCHIIPVTKCNIEFIDNKIITSHSITNVEWGFKFANLLQQDHTIDNMLKMMLKIIENHSKYKINSI